MHTRGLAASLLFVGCATTNGTTSEKPLFAGPPATEKQAVTDTFHGTQVVEHYRWLERWEDERVKAWSAAQNDYARLYLDGMPNVDALRARVTEILSAKSTSYYSIALAGDRIFVKKFQPPKSQPFLVVLDDLMNLASEQVLVDPTVVDPSGKTTIDWFVPSPDGKLVAVSLSKGGTESGDVHVYDVEKKTLVFEVVPRANSGTAGGSLAWMADSSGFFYTRHPWPGERPEKDQGFFQQLYFHTLGTDPKDDRYELGRDFPRIAEIQLDIDHDSGRLLATVQEGDGGQFSHFLRAPDGQWRQFSTFGDKTLQATFGENDDLFVLSRKDAPRGKLLRIDIKSLDVDKAQLIIDESDATIVEDFWGPGSVIATKNRLFVMYQLGGPSEIRAFDLNGAPMKKPDQLPVSAVRQMVRLGEDDVLFSNPSYLEPPAWYIFRTKDERTEKTALVTKSPVDMSGIEVIRELATSKDGTKVPVNIIMKKGTTKNGKNPIVVYGYGGYGVNLVPRFSPASSVLLEQGVIYAIANLRGGGEFGEQWHRQGNLTNKQNVFDDFAAVISHLHKEGYSAPERTAILGGSNGGLLMGATMVQNPKLARAVVSFVGIYDMLRVELSPNGAFNITEFGTVKNPAHFKALYAYSPYHNVTDNTAYPATLFLTGANDPRVDPMQSRKMTARLQAANVAGTPILLRTSMDTGHGGGTPLAERINQTVDAYGFILTNLGVRYAAPAR